MVLAASKSISVATGKEEKWMTLVTIKYNADTIPTDTIKIHKILEALLLFESKHFDSPIIEISLAFSAIFFWLHWFNVSFTKVKKKTMNYPIIL